MNKNHREQQFAPALVGFDDWMASEAKEHQAEQARVALAKVAADTWRRAWPLHCRACGGWGGHGFTERHGFAYGSGEPMFDPCEAQADPATCHRCGGQGLTQDSEGPCTLCGWDYDDGAPK